MSIIKKISSIKALIKNQKIIRSLVSSYLFFIENPQLSSWGSITSTDEEGIRYAVKLSNNYEGPIIEIGALFGHTTNLISSLKKDSVTLIAVENFTWNPFNLPTDSHREFTKRTLRYVTEHCKTIIYDGDSQDFYSANKNIKPSMIFIDAGHDYESVKKDIMWAVSIGCPVISGHDYMPLHSGVVRAVNETFGHNISIFGSVWVHNNI